MGGMFPPTITPDLIDFMRVSYASAPLDDLLAERGIERVDLEVPGHEGHCLGRLGAATGRGHLRSPRSPLRALRRADVRRPVQRHRPGPRLGGPAGRGHGDRRLPPRPRVPRSLSPRGHVRRPRVDRFPLRGPRDPLRPAARGRSECRWRAGRRPRPRCPRPWGTAAVRPGARLPDARRPRHHRVDASVRRRSACGTGSATRPAGAPCSGRSEEAIRCRRTPHRRGPTDLSGLPPAFIDVGAAEIFRDEAIDYADAIWRAGGDAELHVWSGAFHACDIFAPHTAVGRSMIQARDTWVEKILGD